MSCQIYSFEVRAALISVDFRWFADVFLPHRFWRTFWSALGGISRPRFLPKSIKIQQNIGRFFEWFFNGFWEGFWHDFEGFFNEKSTKNPCKLRWCFLNVFYVIFEWMFHERRKHRPLIHSRIFEWIVGCGIYLT